MAPIPLKRGSVFNFIHDHPKAPPEKLAFIDATTQDTLTYGAIKSRATSLAYSFVHKLGLKPGDVMLIIAPNCLFYPLVLHASQAALITITFANVVYTAGELAHQLQDARVKLIVAGESVLNVALEAAKMVGIEERNVWSLPESDKDAERAVKEGKRSVACLEGKEQLVPLQVEDDKLETTISYACYSSGTTGKPKGVATSHNNLTSQIQIGVALEPGVATSKEVWLGFVPFSHVYGVFFFQFHPVYLGATAVILRKFDLEIYLATIEKYRVTYGHIVPPIAAMLAKSPLVDKYDLSSVRCWRSGAAPLGPQLFKEFCARLKKPLVGGYGLTEATCTLTSGRLEGFNLEMATNKHASVGVLVPNIEVKVVNGELMVRGPITMVGYLNNPKATEEAFVDGWLRTGDVGYFDEDGEIYITDRVKEFIKYNGLQVSPAELEDRLLHHEAILQAGVTAIYSEERTTELPVAFVVLRPGLLGTKELAQDIISWLAKETASYKKLRGGLGFLEEIPKTTSGKILRRDLKEGLKKGDFKVFLPRDEAKL